MSAALLSSRQEPEMVGGNPTVPKTS